MAVIPVNVPGLNLEEYWQIQALSIEWLFVLDKLNKSVKAKPEDKHCLLGMGMGNQTIYFLKKSFFPVEVMMKATGLTKDQLEGHVGIIQLKSKPVEGFPEATVPGWGEA